MFGLFKSKEESATERFWKSDTGQRLKAHNARYFGPGARWQHISDERKQNYAEWLLQRVFGVLQAETPFIQMRTEMATMGSRYAELAVLTNGAVPQSMRSQYISEQLPNHIRVCAAHCEELNAKLAREPTTSDNDLVHYANARSVYYTYMLNGINKLRFEFGDFASTPGNDWLNPFVRSMMIWHEDLFRSKIGQASLFKDKRFSSSSHSTFFNLVRNGHQDPLKEWEETYGRHADRC